MVCEIRCLALINCWPFSASRLPFTSGSLKDPTTISYLLPQRIVVPSAETVRGKINSPILEASSKLTCPVDSRVAFGGTRLLFDSLRISRLSVAALSSPDLLPSKLVYFVRKPLSLSASHSECGTIWEDGWKWSWSLVAVTVIVSSWIKFFIRYLDMYGIDEPYRRIH